MRDDGEDIMTKKDSQTLTEDAVNKFFDSPTSIEALELAGKRLTKEIDDFAQDRCNQFAWYLKDEFRLLFGDIVEREVKAKVLGLLKGEIEPLIEYGLAPFQYDDKVYDIYGVLKLIVENNKDIIASSQISLLQDTLDRTTEELNFYKNRNY